MDDFHLNAFADRLEAWQPNDVLDVMVQNYDPRGFSLRAITRLVLSSHDFMAIPKTVDVYSLVEDQLQGDFLLGLEEEHKTLVRHSRYLVKPDGADFPSVESISKESVFHYFLARSAQLAQLVHRRGIVSHFYSRIAVDSFAILNQHIGTHLAQLVDEGLLVRLQRGWYQRRLVLDNNNNNKTEIVVASLAMACSDDPEAERPRNYREAISGDNTWETFGIQLKWTEPTVPGNIRLAVNELVRLRLCVETKRDLEVPPEDLTAWCWTHIRYADNPCGIWKKIKLDYNPRCTQWNDSCVTSYVFQSAIVPTKDDVYRLTFNVKYDRIMIWANNLGVDNILNIQIKPSVGTQTIIFLPVHFSGYFSGEALEQDSQKSTSTHKSSSKLCLERWKSWQQDKIGWIRRC